MKSSLHVLCKNQNRNGEQAVESFGQSFSLRRDISKERLTKVFTLVLSAVLLVAGISKLITPESTESYVYVLNWLPISVTLFVLDVLPLVEILTAIAVWMKPIQKVALWVMSGNL